jgi:hypothetical protein
MKVRDRKPQSPERLGKLFSLSEFYLFKSAIKRIDMIHLAA